MSSQIVKSAILLTLAASFVAVAHAAQNIQAEADKKFFQGKWEFASQIVEGKEEVRKGEEEKHFWIIEGKKIRSSAAWGEHKATFVLDPTKSPKAIDIIEEGNKNVIHGIYQLTGNEIKICAADTNEQPIARPTAFASTKVYFVVVLKRVVR
jgi:uncharacterized protein (TIGR03067 family)